MSFEVIRNLVATVPAHILAHRLAKALDHADPEAVKELDAILPLWVPNAPKADGTPNPQSLAVESLADELFYGGQAGGGKSSLLNGLAGGRHIRSLILRRELTQATDMIDEARAMAGRFGRWNGQRNQLSIWRPGEPRRLVQYAGIPNEDDKNRFKGRAHDLKGFDEVTEFTFSQYTFIIAWNRTTVRGQRARVVATGNPPTHSDGLWVIERWAPWLDERHPDFPAKAGELRWYLTIDGKDTEVDGPAMVLHKGERLYPRSRSFIPATLADNPILEASGYRARLQNLPEPLRSQLLHGDFRIGLEDGAFQLVPTSWLRLAVERWKNGKRPTTPQTHVGVDVARGGKDRTTVCPRRGSWVDPILAFPGSTTQSGSDVASVVLPVAADGGLVAVDGEGVGAAAYDAIRAARGKMVVSVLFGSGAPAGATDRSGTLQFANLRAYSYWMLREALDPDPRVNPDPLALPDDRELFGELAATEFGTRSGRIIVREKDEIKKKIGRSPDKADALAVTFAESGPVSIKGRVLATNPSEFGSVDSFSWGSPA